MLEARNLSVNYDERVAVADVSLSARPGEVIAIIGPNGAGKSTFLRALNGSVNAFQGSVLLDGAPLSGFARRSLARRIAVVAIAVRDDRRGIRADARVHDDPAPFSERRLEDHPRGLPVDEETCA